MKCRRNSAAAGAELQDVVWQNYLADTQQGADTDRSRVTIDGIAWEPDAHRVTVAVTPIATKNDVALPEPWTCVYDVTARQIEAANGSGGRNGNGRA